MQHIKLCFPTGEVLPTWCLLDFALWDCFSNCLVTGSSGGFGGGIGCAGDKNQGGKAVTSTTSQVKKGGWHAEGEPRERDGDWALEQQSATSAGTVRFASIPCFTGFLLQCPLG